MDKKKLFYGLKIVIAAILAIVVATVLKLEFAVSAGIITILSVQRTKKETVSLAFGRFLAFVSALVIAFGSFTLLGYNLKGFVLYLLIFILLCQVFSWQSAMAVDSVLISHFLNLGDMAPLHILNEVLIFVIGVSLGILANLHLNEDVKKMNRKVEQLDLEICGILARMSKRVLMEDKSDYSGACFERLSQVLYEAKEIAQENQDNQFKVKNSFDKEYVLMREKQCAILLQMYKDVRKIETTPVQAEKLSHLLETIATEYHKDNTVDGLLEEWKNVSAYMKEQPLPAEREEFESRALLFGLLCEIEEFLEIKQKFSKEFLLRNCI